MAEILKTGYPMESDTKKYLMFAAPASNAKVNMILQQRVAAWLRDNKFKATGCFGYRATATQKRLYDKWIAYRNYRNFPTKYPAVPKANPAARPGMSWHEFGGAIDLQGVGIKAFVEKNILPFGRNNQSCNKYGISFTMNKVDAQTQLEWWHVVMVESANYKGDRSKFF